MIITKDSKNITYKKTTTEHTVIINDKEVRIYAHTSYSDHDNDYDDDTEIDEKDKEKLTEEEKEVFDEYMGEIMDLEEGESYDSIKN